MMYPIFVIVHKVLNQRSTFGTPCMCFFQHQQYAKSKFAKTKFKTTKFGCLYTFSTKLKLKVIISCPQALCTPRKIKSELGRGR